jgi:hypothetical protein
MAKHIYLGEGQSVTATNDFLATPEHKKAASTALQLMNCSTRLEVRDIQIPADNLYTCWYVSLKGYPKLPVINFSLQKSGSLTLNFAICSSLLP